MNLILNPRIDWVDQHEIDCEIDQEACEVFGSVLDDETEQEESNEGEE